MVVITKELISLNLEQFFGAEPVTSPEIQEHTDTSLYLL